MPLNYFLWDLKDARGFNAGDILECVLLKDGKLDCAMEDDYQHRAFSVDYGKFYIEGQVVPKSDFVFLNGKDMSCGLNKSRNLVCTVDQ